MQTTLFITKDKPKDINHTVWGETDREYYACIESMAFDDTLNINKSFDNIFTTSSYCFAFNV